MKSPIIEQALESEPNLKWEYVSSVRLDRFDKSKSLGNQARILKAITLEKVRRFRDALLAGQDFPAVIAYRDGDKYVIIDGNHRLEAFELAGRLHIDVYVVDTKDADERLLLTFMMNGLNGDPNTEEETDYHAIVLFRRGFTAKDIAAKFGISRRRVEDAIVEDDGHSRAVKLGVKSPWAKFPSREARVRVQRDLFMDSVFADVVRLVAKYSLGTKDIKALTEKLLSFTSEQAQLDYLHKLARDLKKEQEAQRGMTKRRGGSGRDSRGLFEMHLEFLLKNVGDSFRDVLVAGLTDDEKAEFRAKVQRAREALQFAEQQLV